MSDASPWASSVTRMSGPPSDVQEQRTIPRSSRRSMLRETVRGDMRVSRMRIAVEHLRLSWFSVYIVDNTMKSLLNIRSRAVAVAMVFGCNTGDLYSTVGAIGCVIQLLYIWVVKSIVRVGQKHPFSVPLRGRFFDHHRGQFRGVF